MPNDNKFPESRQKEYLRDLHFATLAERKIATGRELAYLGLPSADMLDIKLWRSVLQHITAVEQDPSLVLPMLIDLLFRERTKLPVVVLVQK